MRYFYVKITKGSSTSTYTIQYVNSSGISVNANKFDVTTSSTSIATGITFQEMVSGNGVLIETPDNVNEISVDDEIDNTCQLLNINTGPGATITITNPTCGLSTITVSNITGGTAPYSVDIGGFTQQSTGQTLTFNNVVGSVVNVTITDSSNPSRNSTKKIQLTDLSQFISFEIVTYPSTSTSSDGVVNLITSGGTFNKTYYLYKNLDYPDSLECLYDTITSQITGVTSSTASQTITGLTCGAYCFRVVDANLCELQSELISVCSTPVSPTSPLNSIRGIRYGGTPDDVCTGGTWVTLFSAVETALVDGGVYTDRNGNLINGLGGGYYKNSGDFDCSYGTINQYGEYYTTATCTNCL